MARIATRLLVVALLMAGSPAFAQPSNKIAASAAAKTAHSMTHRKGDREKVAPEAQSAVAGISDAERRDIQSNLVWLGGFEGMSAEEFDKHTLDAIKAFQRRTGGKETGVLSDQERALLAEAAKAPQDAVGWRLIEDTATGARLGLPEKLVPRTAVSHTGSRWTSAQGQIQIETFRLYEASLPTLFEQEKKTSQRYVGYSVLEPNSFFIAGEQRLKRFVVRAQSRGTEVRGVTILYDQATEGTVARVAMAMSDTFEGFPDPGAVPPPGHKRGVEYGSAIVVTSRGDLVTLGQVVDQCQSITVPGFGHAERIAEDKANDLALLRLYGARKLIPAPLGGDGGTGDTLTLFGIADPLAQSDAGMVTGAPAQLTAQAITPAPQPGFSGAAAVDAQGRFAGIVELKAPVVASAGAASPQATLVPAVAVRAFLQAQGIAPIAGQFAKDFAAMDESVVRVICVRK
jgi:peptidoglycan hydrolase-like protein with peptidoglycan-binding domain